MFHIQKEKSKMPFINSKCKVIAKKKGAINNLRHLIGVLTKVEAHI